jgi:hypothetical protein
MALIELNKIDINITAMSIYNKQLVAVIFNVLIILFRGLLYLYLISIAFKIFKPLYTHLII